MQISVKIRKILSDGKPVKAVVSITLDEQYAVHGVKVIETEKGRFIAMPNEFHKDKDENAVRHDIFHPITSSARKALEDAVYAAYDEVRKNQAE